MRLFRYFFVLIACFLMTPALFAQNNGTASVYVVHGIAGQDLGLSPALPVDVSVNGACALRNFRFGDIAGPVAIPAGTARVAISIANQANPCGGQVAIGPANFFLQAGENASIVASLTADGKPTARKYTNDLSRALGGRAKVAVHHTAAAPLVDIGISPKITINSVRNSEKFILEAAAGSAQVSVSPAGSSTPVFGPVTVELEKNKGYLVYAVGTPANNTFTLLIKSYE